MNNILKDLLTEESNIFRQEVNLINLMMLE